MSSSNCCFLTCIQISQEAGQVVWYSHHFQNFPQFIVIHTVKGFGIVNKAEIDVFLELSCFFKNNNPLSHDIFLQMCGHFSFVLIYFFFLSVTYCTQDLYSLIRDQTCIPAMETPTPNHWTARQVLKLVSVLKDFI